MIRGGAACAKCGGGRCVDPPTEAEPLEIECPVCMGRGCDACGGGWIVISECTQRWLGRWPREFVTYADLFRRGHGIAGSCVMDETKHFIDCYSFYRAELARHAPPDPFAEMLD